MLKAPFTNTDVKPRLQQLQPRSSSEADGMRSGQFPERLPRHPVVDWELGPFVAPVGRIGLDVVDEGI